MLRQEKHKSVKLLATGPKRRSPVLMNYINSPQPQNVILKNSATYVNTKMKGSNYKAIVDSGAESTLISSCLARKLRLKIMEPEDNTVYVAANKEVLKTVGWTLLDLEIGQLKLKQKCIVIDRLSTDILLGTDTLVKYGMIINYQNFTLSCGKISVKIFTNYRQTAACLAANSVITVKPNGTHVEWMKVPENFDNALFVQSANFNNIVVKSGLFEASEGRVPIIITNKRNYPVEIQKGKYLANVEMVDIKVEKSINSVVKELSNKKVDPRKISEIVGLSVDFSFDQKKKLIELLDKYDHVFSKDEKDIGYYDKNKFKIDTGNEKPIKQRAYRIPYAQQENVDKLIDDMMQNKIISKSDSPWASPIVLVKKKDGSDRFCVDYRKLNKITIKDNYPVPIIQETLDSLMGASWFTTLDLRSGYWQMALEEEAKKKTAFISRKGLYQFEVLPFGLSNAVAFFQREMENILEGLTNAKPYLDDIMIHSPTFDGHLTDIEDVFKRLEDANVKLNTGKCLFARRETKFLGFDISKEGIRPSEDKLLAMKNYQVPKNPKQVKRFLGMASYYRKFIPNYSRITEPINKLLKKNQRFVWCEKCSESFNEIINNKLLINPPILVFPDFSLEFILTTDASGTGLGAVLSQIDRNGVQHANGYASRLLNTAEKNYSATELECLAVVWGIEYFRPYLYGRHFVINCDHNPLVYIENMKNKSSRVTRWRLGLAEYDKEIRYIKGESNTNADALSRQGETFSEKKISSVNTAVTDEEMGNWSENFLKKVAEMQEEDEEVVKLKNNKAYFIYEGI